jgi:hypothetical protein
MANIWEIDERLVNLIENQFDTDDGTIYESEEELAKKIDEVALELDTKIENIGCYIKNLESDIEAFKKEEDNLKKRRKSTENKIEGLKTYLNNYLTVVYPNEDDRRKWKFKTPKVVLGYRKSTTVEVPDLEKLDKNFIKIKTETSADKTAIKEAIKNGTEVKGAFLKDNINLSIK